MDDLAVALRQFADRIGALDPPGSSGATVELTVGGTPVVLTASGARALADAMRAYHDPRDRGTCDHCGSRRLDDNFMCADCSQPSGVFGQILRERAARYEAAAGGAHLSRFADRRCAEARRRTLD